MGGCTAAIFPKNVAQMGHFRVAMAAITFRCLLNLSTSFLPSNVGTSIRNAGSVNGNVRRYFCNAEMTVDLPKHFEKYFRFAAYNRIDRIKLLEATGGKYGHIFGDNLMQNGDFRMQIYVNTTSKPAEINGLEPHVTAVDTEDFDDAICFVPKRDFITEYVHIVDVGSLCCGHKGVWHGGITSAIFDNAFGILGCTILKMAATKYLNIQFKAPIMVGDSVALIVSFDPKQLNGEKKDRFVATGKMINQNGVVVATGESELVDVWERWQKNAKKLQNGQ
ncbi:thioesterase family protein, putative [Babesia ovis]|uniref:Thioesterase family protein, putative n=1 Tax=Babesia ovis TaxID=5869 RepID=A0A9W5TCK5_BABOV|nr:thioesterase family protein, putative [Babesia ovis]